MTLEELKALWDKALADATAKPDDKVLAAEVAKTKKAYEDAKAKAEVDPDPDPEPSDDDKLDEGKLDDKTKAYLAKLRKENAGHRTKNKDLLSKFQASEEQKKAILKAAGLLDEEEPEEKLKMAEAATNQLAFRNAILESAVENGIPKDKLKYYQFLIADATEQLGEGEELSEEKMVQIVAECKKGGDGKKANSTVQRFDKDGKLIKEPSPGESGEMTLEKFCAMGIVEKSKLYQTSPDVYETFAKQAKAKGKLI